MTNSGRCGIWSMIGQCRAPTPSAEATKPVEQLRSAEVFLEREYLEGLSTLAAQRHRHLRQERRLPRASVSAENFSCRGGCRTLPRGDRTWGAAYLASKRL